MNIKQQIIQLSPVRRGFHLITRAIEQQLSDLHGCRQGLAHIMIMHTSASLTINENADPDVRYDFESIFNHLVPENEPYYTHTMEGSDDMPAHVKASLLGSSITVPVRDGRFLLGTWQGVYLCEHRNHGGSRKLAVTITGEW